MEQQELIEKIKRLPQDSVAEVEDFVDSLTRRERGLNRTSLHQALTNYATQHAGTKADLDPDLVAATTGRSMSAINVWREEAARFRDDPTFDEFVTETQSERRNLDSEDPAS